MIQSKPPYQYNYYPSSLQLFIFYHKSSPHSNFHRIYKEQNPTFHRIKVGI